MLLLAVFATWQATSTKAVVPNLFLTVAHFDFENFPWPTLKLLLNNLTQIHQNSSGFSGWKQVISKKRSSPSFKRFSGRKQVISKEKNKVFTEIHAVFPAENRWFKHDFLKYDFNQSALWQCVAHCKMPCGLQVEKHCTKALQDYLKLGSKQ